MLRRGSIFVMIICLYQLLSVACTYAEEAVDDLVDVLASDGKIVAIIEGERTTTVDLRLKETVLWSDSQGYLGGVLTDSQFYVISASSGVWQAFPLKLDASEKEVASLSDSLALLVTGDRAVVFDAASNQFVEARIPLQDELISAQVENHVAVVITSSRVLGFVTDTTAFAEERFKLDETVEGMKVTSQKAIIRTSERLLTFSTKTLRWNALSN